MNSILILGAGDLGKVVAEMVESKYEKINFLDDGAIRDSVIGRTDELDRFIGEYTDVICAFGNNEVRQRLRFKAKELGYSLPIIIHPSAIISPSAYIGEGVIIRENVAISREVVIEPGCIINMGVLVDHCCVIGHDTHIPMGTIVRNNVHIPPLSVFKPGAVVE